jgi:hypothetical protein
LLEEDYHIARRREIKKKEEASIGVQDKIVTFLQAMDGNGRQRT